MSESIDNAEIEDRRRKLDELEEKRKKLLEASTPSSSAAPKKFEFKSKNDWMMDSDESSDSESIGKGKKKQASPAHIDAPPPSEPPPALQRRPSVSQHHHHQSASTGETSPSHHSMPSTHTNPPMQHTQSMHTSSSSNHEAATHTSSMHNTTGSNHSMHQSRSDVGLPPVHPHGGTPLSHHASFLAPAVQPEPAPPTAAAPPPVHFSQSAMPNAPLMQETPFEFEYEIECIDRATQTVTEVSTQTEDSERSVRLPITGNEGRSDGLVGMNGDILSLVTQLLSCLKQLDHIQADQAKRDLDKRQANAVPAAHSYPLAFSHPSYSLYPPHWMMYQGGDRFPHYPMMHGGFPHDLMHTTTQSQG